METCGDNRFEIIARAKKALLEKTNIEGSPEEMAVIDNFLFRCWQMGWLNGYDDVREVGKKNDEPTLDPEKAYRSSLLNVQSTLLYQVVDIHQKIERGLKHEFGYNDSYDRGFAKGLMTAYDTIGSL